MIIRLATKEDLPAAFERFVAFEQCSSMVTVVPSVCVANYSRFIDQGTGGLILALDREEIIGGLGYVIAKDLHCDKKYAVETFWLMLPKHRGGGVRLMAEFERIARESGCDECAMIHLKDSFPTELEHLYIRRGYHMVEKHYIKRMKP